MSAGAESREAPVVRPAAGRLHQDPPRVTRPPGGPPYLPHDSALALQPPPGMEGYLAVQQAAEVSHRVAQS